MTTTADAKKEEYRGLSASELADLKRQDEALDLSSDFCRPHFDRFARYMKLYSGFLPDELDFTYSKIMLRLATAIVQNDIPRTTSNVLSETDFFRLHPNLPEFEDQAEAGQAWLWYHLMKRNRFATRIVPTFTQVGIYGTAHRFVTYRPFKVKQKVREPRATVGGIPSEFRETEKTLTEMGIISEDLDIFSVMPSPTGTVINSLDCESEECIDWLHLVRYLSKSQLEAMAEKKYAKSDKIKQMIAAKPHARTDSRQIDDEYRQQAASAMLDSEYEDWMTRMRGNVGTESMPRFRCVWTFFRDKWMLVGEGQYLLYSGPPLLDWIPVSKYVDTPHPSCYYGSGLIEMTEDVILAYLLTFALRMDYLAQTMHPTKYVSDDIINANGGNLVNFDPGPWQTVRFPRSVNISEAIWMDRFPDISPQAFMEETKMQYFLQEILGQPNYGKGMGGGGTLANETAVGIVSLIEEGSARSSMRSINIENTGIHDELMLFLKWGKRYAWEDEIVDVGLTPDGYPWRYVDHDAIDDGYGIELCGTRALANKQSMIRNMLQVLPAILNNPNVPNQEELIKETLREMGIFRNMDKFFAAPQGRMMLPGMVPGAGPGRPGRGSRGLPGPNARNLLAGASTPMNEAQAMGGMMELPAEMAVTEGR